MKKMELARIFLGALIFGVMAYMSCSYLLNTRDLERRLARCRASQQEVKNYDDCCNYWKEYRELYFECGMEITRYARQSRDAVCLEELADWYDEIQELENDFADLYEKGIKCREKLFVCETADRLKVKNNR